MVTITYGKPVTRRFVAAVAVFMLVVAADGALAVFALTTAVGAAVTRSPDLVKSAAAFGLSIFAVTYLAQNLVDQLMQPATELPAGGSRTDEVTQEGT